jgi:tetratricopeptide (TPR) repeat protein
MLGAAAIFLVCFIVYTPAIKGGFIWDDDVLLTSNQAIKSPDGLRTIWLTTKLADYFPLTSTMLWIEWRLWGNDPTGYHVINILLHAIAVILLWRVLKQLKAPVPWLIAIVFAVHPVAAASVTWIAEQKNTLSLILYLLTLWFYLKSEPRKAGPQPAGAVIPPAPSSFYFLSIVSFLLALLSKTSVVMLPFVLLGCAWWLNGTITRRDILRSVPFFLLSLILGLVTVYFQHHRTMGGELVEKDGFLIRIVSGSWAPWFYLYKAILPLNASMIYPRWTAQPSSPLAWVPGALWIALLVVCWMRRKGAGRALLFGLGFFFINLLPVLGWFNMSFLVMSRVADHWQYISLIGIVALVIGGAAHVAQGSLRLPAGVRKAAAIAVVTIFGALAWQRAHVIADSERLWRDTLAKDPNCWMAHNNLGYAISRKDNIDEAITHYAKAVELKGNYTSAMNNLGHALAEKGKYAEAIPHYTRALQIEPKHVEVHNNLGNALSNLGKVDAAITHYREALKQNPEHSDANNNLGIALAMKGQLEEAISYFNKSLAGDPGNVSAHGNLGNAYAVQGKFNEAIQHYTKALELNSKDPQTHNNLANVLSGQGRLDEAVAQYQIAIQMRPDNPEAHYNLGMILLRQGKRNDAANHFREALRSNPNYAQAQAQLNALAAQQ